MNGFLMKAGLGTALAASALAAATPATAQRWHRYDRGGDVATGALIGGVVGLGLGAAIASSNRDRYWGDPRGFRGGYRGYYPPPRYNAYQRHWRGPRCIRQWQWDPYYGGRVPVRICR